MVRHLSAFLLAMLILGGFAPAVSAQDEGTPAPRPPRDLSMLQSLGLPEINLVATANDVTGLPDSLPAGWYFVTMENQTADQEVEAYFGMLPNTVTAEQATKDLGSDAIPSWVYEATWAGGPNAYGGQTDGAVINLTPGDWWVGFDRESDSDAKLTDTAGSLTVTAATEGTPTATIEAVPVTLQEFAITFPDSMSAGPQIWDLTNTGKQPHFVLVWGVPEGTTTQQVMGTINSFMTGTPAADALGFEDLHDVYDSTFISGGQHQYIELDLPAGTYAAVCFFEDPETHQNHSLMGMIQVFTVS